MRLLFTAVSAHGHVLPMAPLMRSGLEAGHQVALVASSGLSDLVHKDLPVGVDFLPAGPMPLELATEAANRTGGDVMQPTIDGIGETFGGVLLDQSIDDALPAAREWKPDLIVADMYNPLGSYLSAALDVSWYRFRMSTELPEAWRDAINRSAVERFRTAGLTPTPPTRTISIWPSSLDTETHATHDVLAMQATAHRRASTRSAAVHEVAAGGSVLVTFGTIFSDPELLDRVAVAIAEDHPNRTVVVTEGLHLGEKPAGGTAAESRIRTVPFTPLADLLQDTAAVVSVGGAGTVLGTLSLGIPLVLWPQGADQLTIAAAAGRAGAAVVVTDPGELVEAVRTVLNDPKYRRRASEIRDEVRASPTPTEVVMALERQ